MYPLRADLSRLKHVQCCFPFRNIQFLNVAEHKRRCPIFTFQKPHYTNLISSRHVFQHVKIERFGDIQVKVDELKIYLKCKEENRMSV